MTVRRARRAEPTPEENETFDEFLTRTGSAPSPRVDPYAGLDPIERYRREAEDAVRRHREDFRRLVDEDCFAHVQAVMDRLGVLRRERLVTSKPVFRPIERMRGLGELWLWLSVGVAMKKGRNSSWVTDRDAAVAGIADATAQLRNLITRYHPALADSGPIRDCLDDLRRIHEQLLVFFPPRQKKKPKSEWRHQTVNLLRYEGGLTLAEAEELVRAAGLNTDYPDERRGRTHKPRAQKPSRKSTD